MLETLIFTADDWSYATLEERLGNRLEVEKPIVVQIDFLDTFDWLIFKAGCELTLERRSGKKSLHWRSAKRPFPYVVPSTHDIKFAHTLPPGYLRDLLATVTGVRALLTVGAARVTRQHSRILDKAGNSLAKLTFEESAPLLPGGTSAGSSIQTVTIRPVGAKQKDMRRLTRLMHDTGAIDGSSSGTLTAAAEAYGRSPGDYSSKPKFKFGADRRANDVVKKILGRLRKIVIANVDGILNDVDVEFLHDLRVACRRTRSALNRMRGVLPRDEAESLEFELRWLGDITGPCRDLDVYLLEMTDYRRRLGDDAHALDDLEKLLRRERAKELRRVRRALRSQRFARLLKDWRTLAKAKPSEPEAPKAARPIKDFASAKIFKAYQKMIRRGASLGKRPTADMHRLRIDAKKLRYMLEFFGCLYPRKTTFRLVKELKQLQTILGGFNDMAVQQQHLASFAETLMHDGSATADTVFAMGRLADEMASRQAEFGEAAAKQFQVFAGDQSREIYRETFGGG